MHLRVPACLVAAVLLVATVAAATASEAGKDIFEPNAAEPNVAEPNVAEPNVAEPNVAKVNAADVTASVHAETLKPLAADGSSRPPASFAALWASFDPQAEPLETETLAEWDEDGIRVWVVRFTVGTFKGQPARVAAVYAAPPHATADRPVPGLVQIHGGGQYADAAACLANARRGYATVSVAWAGRISASRYRVSPAEVQLFWGGQTDDPRYRVTTDWGRLDGYHAPSRNPGNAFPSIRPAAWTLDAVESPRNSGWFLAGMAARRALTFLESQPEVDGERLGVYGHSMGGKLTVMTAADPRVKAAVPSCGGISDRDNDSPLFRATLADDAALPHVTCPTMFLSPSNDFHGRLGDLPEAVEELASDDCRVSCSPHHNHQDAPEYEINTLLWFDQHLRPRGGQPFAMPPTPTLALRLDGDGGVPHAFVRTTGSRQPVAVDVYFTQQLRADETAADREQVTRRFWQHASTTEAVPTETEATKIEATETEATEWTATLPLATTDQPLTAFANLTYPLETPRSAVGYYYRPFETDRFVLSSLPQTATAADLQTAGCLATQEATRLIEDFADGWERAWFSYRPERWPRTTHKLGAIPWRAPKGATLGVTLRSERPNTLVVRLDDAAAEVPLAGRRSETVVLRPGDFRDVAGQPLATFEGVRSLTLSDAETLRPARRSDGQPLRFGRRWSGPPPQFKQLEWRMPE